MVYLEKANIFIDLDYFYLVQMKNLGDKYVILFRGRDNNETITYYDFDDFCGDVATIRKGYNHEML